MNLSIVIPAYNEEQNIGVIVKESLSSIESVSAISEVEIIVVDDHSSDNTFKVIEDLNDNRVRCLRLSKRSGSHVALRAGIRSASGDAVLCISADGQDDPAALKDMIEKRAKGSKVVWALRKNRQKEPWYVSIPAALFYKILTTLTNQQNNQIDLSRADFYLLDRDIVNAINSCPERKTSLFGLLLWIGFKHDFVEYERRKRKHGKSKWNFSSRLALAKDWIVAFSQVPLKLVFYMGIFATVVGFLYAFIVFLNVILRNPVQGWSSLMMAILILGGIQLIMLGILGEYLGQNLDETRKRPIYFIENKTENFGNSI